MRISQMSMPLAVAFFAMLSLGQTASAAVLINVDKSAQRMIVVVDGTRLYDWPVSTGGGGYETPSGTFKPFRMEIDHYSKEWDNAPMPYSIFFTQNGDAIHGTYEQRSLGRAVSHGCVRLSRKNAATLWELVKREKMANTTVVLTGTTPGAGPPAVARSRPMPLNADDPSYGMTVDPRYAAPPPQYQRRDDGYGPPALAQTPRDYYDRDDPSYEVLPRPQYQPRYDDDDDADNGRLLPFPFLFGR